MRLRFLQSKAIEPGQCRCKIAIPCNVSRHATCRMSHDQQPAKSQAWKGSRLEMHTVHRVSHWIMKICRSLVQHRNLHPRGSHSRYGQAQDECTALAAGQQPSQPIVWCTQDDMTTCARLKLESPQVWPLSGLTRCPWKVSNFFLFRAAANQFSHAERQAFKAP